MCVCKRGKRETLIKCRRNGLNLFANLYAHILILRKHTGNFIFLIIMTKDVLSFYSRIKNINTYIIYVYKYSVR